MLECPKGRIQRQQVSVKATLPCRGENKQICDVVALCESFFARSYALTEERFFYYSFSLGGETQNA